jgi:hypothetical protein
MVTEGSEHLVNLDRFENYHAKEAYLAIVLGAERSGYRSRPGSKGTIRHTSFHADGTTPFALIANKNDLLFYIRQPALRKWPELASEAVAKFDDDVLTKQNSLNETRSRIRGSEQALKLVEWLFSQPRI